MNNANDSNSNILTNSSIKPRKVSSFKHVNPSVPNSLHNCNITNGNIMKGASTTFITNQPAINEKSDNSNFSSPSTYQSKALSGDIQDYIQKRTSSIKRLPFSFIKDGVQSSSSKNSCSNSNTSIDEPQLLTSPKLLDDNYFMYSNNNPNILTNLGNNRNNNIINNSSSKIAILNNKIKNNYNFQRSTTKTSSFHNYRRYSSRYLLLFYQE